MARGGMYLIAPGVPGCDAAFPDNAAFIASTYKWMGRYLSIPTSNAKNLKSTELDLYAQHDKATALFVEQAETTVLTGYSQANINLAKQAVTMANSFNAPGDAIFWYAGDTDTQGHESVVVQSFQAYKDNSAGHPLGAYICSQVGELLLDQGLIQYLHVPSAVYWSRTSKPADGKNVFVWHNNDGSTFNYYISPRAHIRQHTSIAFGTSRIDPNDILLSVPMWFPGRADPPTPQEDDKMIVNPLVQEPSNGPVWFSPFGLSRRWVQSPAALRSLAVQLSLVTGTQAYGPTPFTDAQIVAACHIAGLANAGDLAYFGNPEPGSVLPNGTIAGTVDLSPVMTKLNSISAQITAIPGGTTNLQPVLDLVGQVIEDLNNLVMEGTMDLNEQTLAVHSVP